ncbi:hypothetical protein DPMN_159880 [Dreissena polymorpha]|uniref:Tyrosine-protein phosphatase domain-containing protein n=1 Tax=Dreissena polymorpha TaxID=45954 RepID=A0A9D4IPK4_DREPO|nr:hypothetical protein DPMN_159880 [Dreissena polymorpha]
MSLQCHAGYRMENGFCTHVSLLLSDKENIVPFDDNNYYSFKTLGSGIQIHELWDYTHEKCQSGSTFFEEEFKGFEKAKKLIASQGTTEKNLDDFWRMIWQQRVDKIVMLTHLIEMRTMKCLQYWPEELNSVCKYGRIDVKYVDVEEMSDYNIRTFTIKKGHDTRVVKQFHFKSWPDKGVPDTAWCLVDFWRAVNTQDEHQPPILVHCSVESREGHLQLVVRPEAEYGNIGPNVTEIDVYRPQQQITSEPPDEINIHAFNALTEIIVLRKPNEQQLPMFWSRLEKLGSTTLIDLASGDIEMKHLLINRKDGTRATKGPSSIKQKHQHGFAEITYSMTHEAFRDKTIKHFLLSSWKEGDISTDRK